MDTKISFIKVENFKLFDNLDIDGFQRVNLIGGKNNIGKTALLEAINLNLSSVDFNGLLMSIKNIMHKRHNTIEIDMFKQDKNSITIKTDKNKISLTFDNKIPEAVLYLGINGKQQVVSISNVFNGPIVINQYKFSKVNFISSGYIDMIYLSELYSSLVSLGKDNFIDESLKLFDENIVSIRQIMQGGPVFKVKMKNIKNPILLSSLGEGINRFMAIVCAIWASQNGCLLIDEIENGIHYTNYEKLWDIIFKVSKDANCQVFATTHSRECIEIFNKLNINNDGVYIELYKNKKTDQIIAKLRDYEVLNYSLNHNGRFRGE